MALNMLRANMHALLLLPAGLFNESMNRACVFTRLPSWEWSSCHSFHIYGNGLALQLLIDAGKPVEEVFEAVKSVFSSAVKNIHYTARYADGTVFDSSYKCARPLTMRIGIARS